MHDVETIFHLPKLLPAKLQFQVHLLYFRKGFHILRAVNIGHV